MLCPYCENKKDDFVLLNQLSDYGGVEAALNNKGVMRIRHYRCGTLYAEDYVELKHCPFCGKKFNK